MIVSALKSHLLKIAVAVLLSGFAFGQSPPKLKDGQELGDGVFRFTPTSCLNEDFRESQLKEMRRQKKAARQKMLEAFREAEKRTGVQTPPSVVENEIENVSKWIDGRIAELENHPPCPPRGTPRVMPIDPQKEGEFQWPIT